MTLFDIKHSRIFIFFQPQWRITCSLWARIFQKWIVPTLSKQQNNTVFRAGSWHNKFQLGKIRNSSYVGALELNLAKMLTFYVRTLVLRGFKILYYHRYLFQSLWTTMNLNFLFKACIQTLLQETLIFLKGSCLFVFILWVF